MAHRRRIVAVLFAVALVLALALGRRPQPPSPELARSTAAAERPVAPRDLPWEPAPEPAPAPVPRGGASHHEERGVPPVDGWGTLVVDVVDERGLAVEHAYIVPVDCPALHSGMAPGERRLQVGPCTVRARRQDGALFTNSAPATVEVVPTDPAYVLLELPSARTGGIGVRFLPEESGMRVVEVVPDSAAADAGLAAGDLVLDVGGHATAGMEPGTFVELMTGAEGSDVTFTVGWSGDTGLVEETLTVARRFLDG